MKQILGSKLIRFVVMPIIGLALLVLLGGGWYFSGVLEEDGLRVDNALPDLALEVVAREGDSITLKARDGFDVEIPSTQGFWGISDGSGYGQVSDILSESDGSVTRDYAGDFQAGDYVFLDRTAFPHDPLSAYGLEYEEVTIPGPLGDFGAWYIPGDSSVWAILVHGRTSNRDTSIKILDDLASIRTPTLTIDYRNDEGAPSSESGFYDFGVTEWEDVEAAVKYALIHGAEKVVLIGYSMGGGVVVNYQLSSEFADRTVGIILDSPMLDFGQTVDHGAAERGVPTPITAIAKFFTNIRYGVDWNALDFISRSEELDVPILLIHGDADDTVPHETSVQFAAASPDIVEFHSFEDAGHVASWNMYTKEYENLVRVFVVRVS
jgi:pimeloyl-ACP methyl ester carboxylesterase